MKRKSIRDAAIVLVNSITEFAGKVRDNDPFSTNDLQLPNANISYGDEELSEDIEDQFLEEMQVFSVPLLIEFLHEGTSGLTDFIDQTIYDVREVFRADPTIGGHAVDSYYTSTTEPEIDSEGSKPVVTFTISIKVKYVE